MCYSFINILKYQESPRWALFVIVIKYNSRPARNIINIYKEGQKYNFQNCFPTPIIWPFRAIDVKEHKRRDSPTRKSISRYGRHKFEISRTVSFFLLYENFIYGAYNKVHVVVIDSVPRVGHLEHCFCPLSIRFVISLEYRLLFQLVSVTLYTTLYSFNASSWRPCLHCHYYPTFRFVYLSFCLPYFLRRPYNSLLSFLIIRIFAFRQCLITLCLFVSSLSSDVTIYSTSSTLSIFLSFSLSFSFYLSLSLISRFLSGFVYIFIKIVEYIFAIKTAMDFEKTYGRETILPVLITNLQQIFSNLLFLNPLCGTLSLSTVRIVSVLSVICRQIVVFPFLLCLVFLSLRCVSHMTDIHNSMLRIVYLRTWSCVHFTRTLNLIARLLRERLCCVLFIISFLFLSYIIIIYIYYIHTIRTRDNNSTNVHVRFLFYRRIGKSRCIRASSVFLFSVYHSLWNEYAPIRNPLETDKYIYLYIYIYIYIPNAYKRVYSLLHSAGDRSSCCTRRVTFVTQRVV
ncbi:hypothetical protein PUN28_004720 [Cardiocondyla obscurior]|uniref:Uncharacterized protein n=1 Tax=Cardiocondyla obscurior TaxID=286306 RepID=A0AAW2GHD0_9HYME